MAKEIKSAADVLKVKKEHDDKLKAQVAQLQAEITDLKKKNLRINDEVLADKEKSLAKFKAARKKK